MTPKALKTIHFIADDPELKRAVENWLPGMNSAKSLIVNPLAKLHPPLEWESALTEVRRTLADSNPSESVILISAHLSWEGPFGLLHTGMELVHHVRVRLESRIPVILFCCETKELFVEAHPFHRILKVEEKRGWKGHYYWSLLDGGRILAGLIDSAEPFLGTFRDLETDYFTLPGLAANAGHEWKRYIQRYPASVALRKIINYLKDCLPAETAVLELESTLDVIKSDLTGQEAEKLIEPLMKSLPAIIGRHEKLQESQA